MKRTSGNGFVFKPASVVSLAAAALITVSLCGFSPSTVAAPLANSDNSEFYYQIGGARSISLPPNAQVNTVLIDGAFEYGLGYSCGNFDPTLGLTNILNGLQGAGNNLINGAVGAVTGAIGALPALVLQRIDPGLYDLFQNALIRAEAMLSLANQSCEDYEQQIRQGQNPFAGWNDLSRLVDWKLQMGNAGFGSAKVDVVQAKNTVQQNNGAHGLPWIGGNKAGGINQAPIKVTEDVVKAGYNLTLNRQADDNSKPALPNHAAPPRLLEVFATPGDASRWAVEVLGDVYIRTHDNHATQTIPGHGLLPKVAKHMSGIQQSLQDLVAGKTLPTLSNLEKVSSNAVLINGDVIAAIKTLQPTEQIVAVSKLASEAAMATVLEQAMLIRRLLITASREPNLNQTLAGQSIQDSITQLDRSIHDVMFERQITNELASRTLALILELQAQHQNRARSFQPTAGSDTKILEDGAIK
jgi:integrating conjugative element protein (TIGR03755 family)